MGFDDYGGGQAQERRRVGEDLHHVGAAFDLLVQPFDYPAFAAGVIRGAGSALAVEALEMVGEGMRDSLVAGGFVGPAAVFGAKCYPSATTDVAMTGTRRFGVTEDGVMRGDTTIGTDPTSRSAISGMGVLGN